MGMNSIRYWPSALVCAVRDKLVPRLVAVTWAFGITAPVRSLTVPYKVVVVCADRNEADNRNSTAADEKRRSILVMSTSGAPGRRTLFRPLILKSSLIENQVECQENVT